MFSIVCLITFHFFKILFCFVFSELLVIASTKHWYALKGVTRGHVAFALTFLMTVGYYTVQPARKAGNDEDDVSVEQLQSGIERMTTVFAPTAATNTLRSTGETVARGQAALRAAERCVAATRLSDDLLSTLYSLAVCSSSSLFLLLLFDLACVDDEFVFMCYVGHGCDDATLSTRRNRFLFTSSKSRRIFRYNF